MTPSILDNNYETLSLSEKVTYLTEILTGFTESVILSDEYKDALQVFSDYEWIPKADDNITRFNLLLEQGQNDVLDYDELNEFIDMVSASGQYHLYFLIRKANRLPTSFNHGELCQITHKANDAINAELFTEDR